MLYNSTLLCSTFMAPGASSTLCSLYSFCLSFNSNYCIKKINNENENKKKKELSTEKQKNVFLNFLVSNFFSAMVFKRNDCFKSVFYSLRYYCHLNCFSLLFCFTCMLYLVLNAYTLQVSCESKVTYGSAMMIVHSNTKYRLYSAKISWGSGSGLQAVTASDGSYDSSLLWIIREAFGSDAKNLGTPIKCGDVIRFEHNESEKFLHSHLFPSPVSKSYEVSAFGGNGESDTNDNFRVICNKNSKQFWYHNDTIKLKHENTQGYLIAQTRHSFTHDNCPRCPILGHLEVAVTKSDREKSSDENWMAEGGVAFDLDSDEDEDKKEEAHYSDEL